MQRLGLAGSMSKSSGQTDERLAAAVSGNQKEGSLRVATNPGHEFKTGFGQKGGQQ